MISDRVKEDDLLTYYTVLKIMQNMGIKFWLDQGSLLGAIRDKSFFPWDHDIDLGVFASDIKEKVALLTKELIAAGASVQVYPYVIKIFMGNTKSVDLRIYSTDTGHAYAELRSTWYKNPAMAVLHKLSRPLYSALNRVGILLYHGKLQFFYKTGLALSNIAIRVQEFFRRRRVIFKVKELYFSELEPINLYGENVSVPKDPEVYLAMKYGSDWRIPKKNWKYWENDGALHKIEYL